MTRAILYAYELWHPSLSEPIRFVDDKAPLIATLEDGAPRNPLEEVEFLACPLTVDRPEESDTASSPTVSLSRPDVGATLKVAFDAARGQFDSWTVIERVYASDDTSAPSDLPPLTFELTRSDIAGAMGRITAAFDDDLNVGVPRTTFKRSEYPGLQR